MKPTIVLPESTNITLVERLDAIIDGYYGDSEDYKVLHSVLKQLDEMTKLHAES